MTTPHILGLAALLRQHKPAASVAEIETSLFKSAVRPTAHRNGARQSRDCQRHCRFELPATLIYKFGMKAQIDPQLSKAIRSSRASGNTIHAAFTLRDDNNGNGLSPR